jgi:hypothetical protein
LRRGFIRGTPVSLFPLIELCPRAFRHRYLVGGNARRPLCELANQDVDFVDS